MTEEYGKYEAVVEAVTVEKSAKDAELNEEGATEVHDEISSPTIPAQNGCQELESFYVKSVDVQLLELPDTC